MNPRASGVAKEGVPGKGYCEPEPSGVGLGQAKGGWSQTWELPGRRGVRKGICCCDEARGGDIGVPELPEWGWERGPRYGTWW